MAQVSKIEWTGRSDWNPIRGCTRKSPGCQFCYAEVIAGRFSGEGLPFHGFATRAAGGRWTGRVEVQRDRLLLPLSWRKPALIFANSTSDICHEALAGHDIAQIVAVAVAAHHLRGHVTQFLTKRPERLAEFTNSEDWWDIVNAAAEDYVMDRVDALDRRSDDARAALDTYGPDNPPPGVWFGVSVEDQTRADERRPAFEAVSAAVKFVSYEPALGPVDWTGWEFVQQIISGGESGRGARASHPSWHQNTRDFSAAHDIAYFFKQWGEWAPSHSGHSIAADGSSPGPDRWNDEATSFMKRLGKKAAGRLLDGVIHDAIPA